MAAGDSVGAAVKTDDSECGCPGAAKDVCATAPTVRLLASFVEVEAPAPQLKKQASKIVEKAKEKLGCGTEKCVLKHAEFQNFARSAGSIGTIANDLAQQFKEEGPRTGNSLLTNVNIDNVLARWAAEFSDFYNCPFAMMDFLRVKQDLCRANLAEIYAGKCEQLAGAKREPVARPCRTFGCVLNTDLSSGGGKHWICVFVDMRSRPFSIEFFNSTGNPPPQFNGEMPVVTWMLRSQKQLADIDPEAKIAPPLNVVHQRGNTECGVSALYYIRAR
ncbi:MAG: hypothetical protein P1U53_17675, partial [Sulfitobacter sp.]|nr:hypothetical protein [Sulfitobacter sp.]